MRNTLLLPALLLASACSNSDTAADGDVSLLFTDAASDELEVFEVEVDAVQLRRADGSTISALTKATRIDFAELESVSELIVGSALPVGFYTGMTLTLDFTNAVVCLVGQSTPATIVDVNGATISGTQTVQVNFAAGSRPQIVSRRNHLWTLDLDLDQSLTIDSGGNRVVFTPTMTASVDGSNPKPTRIQGSLGTVDTGNREFLVQTLAADATVIAPYTVRATTTTVFQVDGTLMVGDAGLAALAARANLGPRIFVQGTLERGTRALNAVAVETGYGVPGNGQDWIHGHIVQRTGGAGVDPTLTVLGQSRDVGTSTRRFNTLHTVTVQRGQTKVLERGGETALDTDELNVGQRVMVFGDMTGTAMAATGLENGVARKLLTSVFGVATAAPVNNVLTLNVARIDLRPISDFDFTVNSTTEATPTVYTVAVGDLTTTDISTGSKIRAIGTINPVGIPADANFTATSLVNRSSTAQLLACIWAPANAGAFDDVSRTALTLDVSAATVKAVADGFGSTPLTTSPAPTVVPLGTRGIYAIVRSGSAEVHQLFSTFADSLTASLTGGATVQRVSAIGTFAPSTQQFSASIASVVLQ